MIVQYTEEIIERYVKRRKKWIKFIISGRFMIFVFVLQLNLKIGKAQSEHGKTQFYKNKKEENGTD